MRHERNAQGKLDGSHVDDSHEVTASGSCKTAIERSLVAVLAVQLQDLPARVGPLEDFYAGIHRVPASVQHDFDVAHVAIERVVARRASLYQLRV